MVRPWREAGEQKATAAFIAIWERESKRVELSQARAARRRGMSIEAYLQSKQTPEGFRQKRLKKEENSRRSRERIRRDLWSVEGLQLDEKIRRLLAMGYHQNSVMQMLKLKLRAYLDAVER